MLRIWGVSTAKCGRGTHGAFIQAPLGTSGLLTYQVWPQPWWEGAGGGSWVWLGSQKIWGPGG